MTLICPLLKANHWFIRAFDFPRIQIVLLNSLYLILTLFYLEDSIWGILISSLVILSFVLDFYRIGPYFSFYRNESEMIGSKLDKPHLKIMSANIFVNNREYHRITQLAKAEMPDLLLLLEPDHKWEEGVEELKEMFPFMKLVPMENTYGMFLFSRFELKNTEVKFLVDDNVPSIFSKVVLEDGEELEIICVHPRPPRPNEATSLQRDAELISVAKYIEGKKDKPILVFGDLNDVAWSHTTRLFKRMSGTLDPRVGRGMYNTFPVKWRFLRIPLDHIFHTPKLSLRSLSVSEDIGSDHFPITASFDILGDGNDSGKPEAKDGDDVEESKEITEKAKNYDGPLKEVKKEDE